MIDLVDSIKLREQGVQKIRSMIFPSPLDFVFDCANLKFALALNFEGHPILVETLKKYSYGRETKMVGGRFGRNKLGHFATSEWSGRCNENWNSDTRAYFVQAMQTCGIDIIHHPWQESQTANYLG